MLICVDVLIVRRRLVAVAGFTLAQFISLNSVQIPFDIQPSLDIVLIGAAASILVCALALATYFRLRKTPFRFVSALIMAGAVVMDQFVYLASLVFSFNGDISVDAL